MTPRRATAQIRKLLASPDFAVVQQGVALLESLGTPEVTATITAGTGLKWDEPIVSPEIKRRVRAAFRPWAALALARLSGALDDADRISLTLPPAIADLTPLAGLTKLRTLVIATGMSTDRIPVDLAPLAGLTGLRRLHLSWLTGQTDLSAIAPLTGLTRLHVYAATLLTDLTPLAGLTALTDLELHGCYHLTDVSPLASLPRLTTLDLTHSHRLTDLTPLAALSELESLDLKMCELLEDLSPLVALDRLAKLDVSHSPKLAHLPQQRLTDRASVAVLLASL